MRLGYSLAICIGMIFTVGQATAQQRGAKDCGNGFYCPSGQACLVSGLCGRVVDRLPGSTRTSTGEWCEPGLREHTYKRGTCIPRDYVDCPSLLSCPPGYRCPGSGETACQGGPPATGPMCGAGQCAQGRICASGGHCMNPQYFQDCGNGTICSKQSACEVNPNGCVLVAPNRTKQIRR
jgi:hypothetical protein